MSTFQHKPNTGNIFKNDKREKESHPNAKGSALIEGVEFWIASWTNEKDGKKYQSLKFSRKDEAKTPRAEISDDGVIPF